MFSKQSQLLRKASKMSPKIITSIKKTKHKQWQSWENAREEYIFTSMQISRVHQILIIQARN